MEKERIPNLDPKFEDFDERKFEKEFQESWELLERFIDHLNEENSLESQEGFRALVKEEIKNFDCRSCARCCRSLSVGLEYRDWKRLAEFLNLSDYDFKQKYLRKDFEGDWVFKQRPCAFLKNSGCSVYEHRPDVCRSYPHLDASKPILWSKVKRNLGVCPIIFRALKTYYLDLS